MLTSLSGGLLGLLDRRFVLTAWLPSLLFWGGLGSVATTGVGWHRADTWWARQPTEFKWVLTALALAWITFFAYLLAAQVSLFIRVGEGYWPQYPPWSWLYSRLRDRHVRRQSSMRDDPAMFGLLYSDYPLRASRVMPTRLGNILRAAEDHPLERYEINAVVVWPRLYVVLPDRFIAAIAAAKIPLDLMATLSALAALFAVSATPIAAALLPWPVALACLTAGALVIWLGYQGAVRAARPYGQLIRAAFDVHRGVLLEAMHLTLPHSYAAERHQWEQISHLWYQGAPAGAEGAQLLGYPTAKTPVNETEGKPQDATACQQSSPAGPDVTAS